MREPFSKDRLLRRGLKLTHLRLIAALAETGQISAAAPMLAMSQPAASRLLGELDDVVGASLYKRHSRGVTLNALGLRLAEWSRSLLSDLDAVDREISELASGERGNVTVGAVTGPALELVLPVLRQIRMMLPGISSTIIVDTSDKLAELLLAERLDFYIGRIPQDADHSRFTAKPLGPEPASLIVRENHPLMRMQNLSMKDCIVYDWVLQAPGGLLRHTVESYLLERGLPLPERIISTSSILMTLALIARSNAISPVARPVAEFFGTSEGLDGRIATLPIADNLVVASYSILTRADRRLVPAAQVFLDHVVKLSRTHRMNEMAGEEHHLDAGRNVS